MTNVYEICEADLTVVGEVEFDAAPVVVGDAYRLGYTFRHAIVWSGRTARFSSKYNSFILDAPKPCSICGDAPCSSPQACRNTAKMEAM